MNQIVDRFIYSSAKDFPENECKIRSANEENIYDSESIYLVLYIDINFENKKYITYAKPYICREENNKVSYGWVSLDGEVFGNIENSCQLWNEFVIGFLKINETFQLKDQCNFAKYKKIIENQWE